MVENASLLIQKSSIENAEDAKQKILSSSLEDDINEDDDGLGHLPESLMKNKQKAD